MMFTKNKMFYYLVQMNPQISGEKIQEFINLMWNQLRPHGGKTVACKEILNYLFKIWREQCDE